MSQVPTEPPAKIKAKSFDIGNNVVVIISDFKENPAVHLREIDPASKKWLKKGVMLFKNEFEEMIKFGTANLPNSYSLTQPLVGSQGSIQLKLRSGKLSFDIGNGIMLVQVETALGTKAISITHDHIEAIENKSDVIAQAIETVEKELRDAQE